jgi:hypothetical protein
MPTASCSGARLRLALGQAARVHSATSQYNTSPMAIGRTLRPLGLASGRRRASRRRGR